MNATKNTRRRGRKSVAKTVKRVIRDMSETKVFYSPISFTTAASTDGEAVDIIRVNQGTDVSQRIGNVIQLRHLKISGTITWTAPGGSSPFIPEPVRVMVFYSSTEDSSTITLNNFLTGSYNPKTFFPLMDKYMSFKTAQAVSGGTSQIVPQGPIQFNLSKAINYYQKYIGAAASNLTRGNLIFVLNQYNNANTTYRVNARVEVWYDDI